MEILKGKVQDPGFPDTEITYLKTDDGKTYFFIENGTLKNGNYIATPILKEGIGHAPYTTLGLVSKDGNVLIPFENKNIQVLSNDLLLVERNKPVTESVVEALNKQSDSLAANELAQNANTIKEQIISVMGSNGNFVFDNQFSEAALYTTDGVNLGNNYFSFIGAKDGAYFMSANVVGSPISKYDPYAFAMEGENTNQEQASTTETTEQEVPQEENVEQTEQNTATEVPNTEEVPVTDVEQSMPAVDIPQVGEETTTEVPSAEEVPATDVEQSMPAIDIPQVGEEATTEVPSTEEVPTTDVEQNMPAIDIPLFGEGGLPMDIPQTTDMATESEQVSEQNDSIPSTEGIIPQVGEENANEDTTSVEKTSPVELNISMDDDIPPVVNEENESTSDEETTEEVEDTDSEDSESEDEIDSDESDDEDSNDSDESDDDSDDDDDDSEEDEDEMEEENSDSSDGGKDKEEVEDEENEDNKSDDEVFYEENLDNPIIANATSTIKKLLEENTNQRQQIDNQESELYTLKSNYELLEQDNAAKTKEIISLRNSLGKARRDNTDLLRENNQLKSTISRLEEINEHYKEQNTALKEQVAGISALSSAVAEADSLFGSDTAAEYSYLGGDESYQYTKTAA